ncbi:unnamed protein product, partial [Durusdinium trenchii]
MNTYITRKTEVYHRARQALARVQKFYGQRMTSLYSEFLVNSDFSGRMKNSGGMTRTPDMPVFGLMMGGDYEPDFIDYQEEAWE